MKEVKISGLMLYLLGLLAVMLIYVNLVLNPLLAKSAELQSQHTSDTAQIEGYIRQMADLGKIEADCKAMETKIAALRQNTAETPTAVSEDVLAALKSAGVQADSLTIGNGEAVQTAAVPGARMMRIPVQLSLKCSRQQLAALLSYFEAKTRKHYYVDKAGWHEEQGGGGSADLSLWAYYYAPMSEASSGAPSAVQAASAPRDASSIPAFSGSSTSRPGKAASSAGSAASSKRP